MSALASCSAVTPRHFTRLSSMRPDEVARILDLAETTRGEPRRFIDALRGQSIACIFEKPSTRTRVSFAAAIARLGATPVMLSSQELQLGRGESLADTARSLSGYVSAIVIRTFAQQTVEELAEWASVPVVNALSDEHHPCQALADLLTIRDVFGTLAGRRLAFLGDGRDNVAHSLIEAGALTGMSVVVGCAPGYEPDTGILAGAARIADDTGAVLRVVHDPEEAVHAAEIVYADVWTSMGQDEKRAERAAGLGRFAVTQDLMSLAQPGAIFMHCLPAHRGQEVAADVIDGLKSEVWHESANRLPTEEALLLHLVCGSDAPGA